jgi:hypothetical protein
MESTYAALTQMDDDLTARVRDIVTNAVIQASGGDPRELICLHKYALMTGSTDYPGRLAKELERQERGSEDRH